MGYFSWLTSDDNKPIVCGEERKVYVLLPEKFEGIVGKHIVEDFYYGYGIFGRYDIYDLVAEMNKEYLSEELLKPAPVLENFGGLWDFEKESMRQEGKSEKEIIAIELAQKQEYLDSALERRAKLVNSMKDYKAGMYADDMDEKYGEEWKREIGIAIACYDEQNASLPYPIKIVSDPDIFYEDALPSMSDPYQGTGEKYDKETKEYINEFIKKLPEYVAIGDARRKE